VLVEASWRGRATVRCTVCGARSGVEVRSEEEWSHWEITGPSDEWLAAHPFEEESPYGDFEPDDVLRDGLPELPAEIAPGTYFPVAMWQDDHDAAVLYVHRLSPGDFDLPGDEYEDETEHLVREDGEWVSTDSGGGNWVNVLDAPRDLLEKYVVLGTGVSGSGDGDEAIYFTGGLCSGSVARVEVTDRDGTRTLAVHAARPFFLVGVRREGTVKVLGREGQVLIGHRGSPLEFDVP
jgi:hypothetical protein